MEDPSSSPENAATNVQGTRPHARRAIGLFARHWRWLDSQASNSNATLRRLVEHASRDVDGKYRARQLKEACYFLMRDTEGDSPFFEEASRALYADDIHLLKSLTAAWPSEIAAKVMALAAEACASDVKTSGAGDL